MRTDLRPAVCTPGHSTHPAEHRPHRKQGSVWIWRHTSLPSALQRVRRTLHTTVLVQQWGESHARYVVLVETDFSAGNHPVSFLHCMVSLPSFYYGLTMVMNPVALSTLYSATSRANGCTRSRPLAGRSQS